MISLKEYIKDNEGFSSKPYKDTTGHLTIGYGRNLNAKGISPAEAEMLLDRDILDAINVLNDILKERCPNTKLIDIPQNIQIVLIDMAFNLGYRLETFRKMLACLDKKDYSGVKREIIDSKWCAQVGRRCIKAVKLIDMSLNQSENSVLSNGGE